MYARVLVTSRPQVQFHLLLPTRERCGWHVTPPRTCSTTEYTHTHTYTPFMQWLQLYNSTAIRSFDDLRYDRAAALWCKEINE